MLYLIWLKRIEGKICKKGLDKMNNGDLIVMEGACDGIGKSTQYQRLCDHLQKDGLEIINHHFLKFAATHKNFTGLASLVRTDNTSFLQLVDKSACTGITVVTVLST